MFDGIREQVLRLTASFAAPRFAEWSWAARDVLRSSFKIWCSSGRRSDLLKLLSATADDIITIAGMGPFAFAGDLNAMLISGASEHRQQ